MGCVVWSGKKIVNGGEVLIKTGGCPRMEHLMGKNARKRGA